MSSDGNDRVMPCGGYRPARGRSDAHKSRTGPPNIDFTRGGRVIAEVQAPRGEAHFNCPEYTNPYPSGQKTGRVYCAGDKVQILSAQYFDGYLSALMHNGGWINVWSDYGKRIEGAPRQFSRNPAGVHFCRIFYYGDQSEHEGPSYPEAARPNGYGGPTEHR